jgi:hypothetical protein
MLVPEVKDTLKEVFFFFVMISDLIILSIIEHIYYISQVEQLVRVSLMYRHLLAVLSLFCHPRPRLGV